MFFTLRSVVSRFRPCSDVFDAVQFVSASGLLAVMPPFQSPSDDLELDGNFRHFHLPLFNISLFKSGVGVFENLAKTGQAID